MTDLKKIDTSWTLFLDRDGVINAEKQNNYIHTWEEFSFLPGVKEAFKIFTEKFGNIFIITNQRGVAKGITRQEELDRIHINMTREVTDAGGRITKIYVCTDMDDSSPNRKPNPGMGLQAKKDFPGIDFSRSVMIGNTAGDMEFGRNLGIAVNIFIPSEQPGMGDHHPIVDLIFPNLVSVARAL